MKTKFKSLEKAAELGRDLGKSIKNNGKKILIASTLPLIFANNAGGDRLDVYNKKDGVRNYLMNIKYILGATEGNDYNYDSPYLESPNSLHIYSHNDNGIDYMVDARPPNSTTTYNLYLKNKGFSGTVSNALEFVMFSDLNFNFTWKNIFLGDANESDNIVADIKHIIYNGGVDNKGRPCGDFPLPDIDGSNVGVYDKRKVFFFNHADLNRDRKVNGLDFAILSQNWGGNQATDPNTFGSYVGSDPNDLGAYSDMNRDGNVGPDDMYIFSGEWLWNADDPNTW